MAGRKNHPKHRVQSRKINRSVLAQRVLFTPEPVDAEREPTQMMVGIDNLMTGNVIPLFR